MNVRFVLVCEGPSDIGLVPLLQVLCVQCGASQAIGVAPDFRRLPRPPKKDSSSKLRAALALEPSANLAFMHRDADAQDEEARVTEIEVAASAVTVKTIPVVPVQQTEAWLLLDETAIRLVVENPRGRQDLHLPGPQRVEEIAQPKRKLKQALVLASGLRGRRLDRFKKGFGRHRAMLLDRLAIDGPVTQVPAWRRLVQRTQQALKVLQSQ